VTLNIIGLALDMLGVILLWRADIWFPRWTYEHDEGGEDRLIKDKEKSPGIWRKRGMNFGLGFLLLGFLFQFTGNIWHDLSSGEADTMTRFIEKRQYENEKGIWHMVIKADDLPDNRPEVHRYYYSVTGPQGEEFAYGIDYSHKVSDSRYRDEYDTEEKRIEDGYRHLCQWIERGKYVNMKWIKDTQGLREEVS